MAHFLVSFRLASDSTYQERYDSVIERIDAIKTNGAVWDETSSVSIFEANGTAASVCDDLYYQTKLNANKDQLVVIDTVAREVAQRGCKYPHLLTGNLGF